MTDPKPTNVEQLEQPTTDGARLRELLEDAAAALEASASLPLFLTSDPTYRAVRLELANVSRMARSLRREPLDSASTYELGRVCTWHGRVSFAYAIALANGRNDDAFCQRLEEAQNALYESYLVMFSRMADLADHWRNREHELAALTVGRRTAHELAAEFRHYQRRTIELEAELASARLELEAERLDAAYGRSALTDLGHELEQVAADLADERRERDLEARIVHELEHELEAEKRRTLALEAELAEARFELEAAELEAELEQLEESPELLEEFANVLEAADRMASLGEATIINVDELRERHGAKRIASLEAELADARATIETLEQRLDVVEERGGARG